MKKIYVVINEQHRLMQEQESILNAEYQGWEYIKIPANGLTLDEIKTQCDTINQDELVIFASPIPAMMSILHMDDKDFSVFHNDHRNKKEIPNGRIIYTVAETGWRIV